MRGVIIEQLLEITYFFDSDDLLSVRICSTIKVCRAINRGYKSDKYSAKCILHPLICMFGYAGAGLAASA